MVAIVKMKWESWSVTEVSIVIGHLSGAHKTQNVRSTRTHLLARILLYSVENLPQSFLYSHAIHGMGTF